MTPAALSLTSLAVEYCKAVAGAPTSEPRDFLRDMLRYLPRIYITDDMVPDTLSELRYRFASYLADTICRALKAANYVYYNADFEG